MNFGDVIWDKSVIVMRTRDSYLAVVYGADTILGQIIFKLISLRKVAKLNKDEIPAWTFKILLVSIYGAIGSKHGIISSKTCAEVTTCAARYFLKNIIAVTERKGYRVIYRDTDSIFAWVKGADETECMNLGEDLKLAIENSIVNTPFASVGADIKGNYKTIIITVRKKCTTVD